MALIDAEPLKQADPQMAQTGKQGVYNPINPVKTTDRQIEKVTTKLGNVPTTQQLTQMIAPQQPQMQPIAPAAGGSNTPPAPPIQEPQGPPQQSPWDKYGWLTPVLGPLGWLGDKMQRGMSSPAYLGRVEDPNTGIFIDPYEKQVDEAMKKIGLGPLIWDISRISPEASLLTLPERIPGMVKVWKETGRNPLEQMAPAWEAATSEEAVNQIRPDEVRGTAGAIGAAASDIIGVGAKLGWDAISTYASAPVIATAAIKDIILGERNSSRVLDAVKQLPGVPSQVIHDIARAYDSAAMDRTQTPFALAAVDALNPANTVVSAPIMAMGKLGLQGLGRIPVISPYFAGKIGTLKEFLGTNLFDRTIFSKGNLAEENVQELGRVLKDNFDFKETDVRGLVGKLREITQAPVETVRALGSYFQSSDSVEAGHALMTKYQPQFEKLFNIYEAQAATGTPLSAYQLLDHMGEIVRTGEVRQLFKEYAGTHPGPIKRAVTTVESWVNELGYWWKPLTLFTRPVYVANNVASGIAMEYMRAGGGFQRYGKFRDLLVEEGILSAVEKHALGTMFAKRVKEANLTPYYSSFGQVHGGELPQLYKDTPLLGHLMETTKDMSALTEIDLKEMSFTNAFLPARQLEMDKWLKGLPEEVQPMFAGVNGVADVRRRLDDILTGVFNPANLVTTPGHRPGVATLLDTELQRLRDNKIVPTVDDINEMFDRAEKYIQGEGLARKHAAGLLDPIHKTLDEEVQAITATAGTGRKSLRSQARMEQTWAEQMRQSIVQRELHNTATVAEVAKATKAPVLGTVRKQRQRYAKSEGVSRLLDDLIAKYTHEYQTSVENVKAKWIPQYNAWQRKRGDPKFNDLIDAGWKKFDDDVYDLVDRFARKKDNLHLIAAEARVKGYSAKDFEKEAAKWYNRDDSFRVSDETSQYIGVAEGKADQELAFRDAFKEGWGGSDAHISGIPVQSWSDLVGEDAVKDFGALQKARQDFTERLHSHYAARINGHLPPQPPNTIRLYAQEGGDFTEDLPSVIGKLDESKKMSYVDMPAGVAPVWKQANGYYAIPDNMMAGKQVVTLKPGPDEAAKLLGGQSTLDLMSGAKSATYRARDWAIQEAKSVQFDAATDTRNFDRVMRSVFPFSFWTTRYYSFLAQTAAKNPVQAQMAGRLLKAWWDANEGLPPYERFSVQLMTLDPGGPDETKVRMNMGAMFVPFGSSIGEVVSAVNKDKADELDTVLHAMVNLVGGGAYPFLTIPAGMLGVSLDGGPPKDPIDTLKTLTPPSNILRQGLSAVLAGSGELGAGMSTGVMTQAERDAVIRAITDDVTLGKLGPAEGKQAVLSMESGNPKGIALDYLQKYAPDRLLTSIGRAIAPPVTQQDLASEATSLAYRTLAQTRTRSEKDLVLQNFPGLGISLSGKRGPERELATIHLAAPKNGVARSIYYQQNSGRLDTLKMQMDAEDGVEPKSYVMKSASPQSFQAFRLAGGSAVVPSLVKYWFDHRPLPDDAKGELNRLYNEAPMGALTYRDWRDRILLDAYMQWNVANIDRIRQLKASGH